MSRQPDERGHQPFFALLAIAQHETRGDRRVTVRGDQSDHGGKAGDRVEHAERARLEPSREHHLGDKSKPGNRP
jgi:hypothetical protein